MESYPYLREMTFHAPDGVPEEDCGDLDALVGHYPHADDAEVATPMIVSFWKPSDEELEILNAGGRVELIVWNNALNPMAMNAVPQ
jgi:hypothetical protein